MTPGPWRASLEGTDRQELIDCRSAAGRSRGQLDVRQLSLMLFGKMSLCLLCFCSERIDGNPRSMPPTDSSYTGTRQGRSVARAIDVVDESNEASRSEDIAPRAGGGWTVAQSSSALPDRLLHLPVAPPFARSRVAATRPHSAASRSFPRRHGDTGAAGAGQSRRRHVKATAPTSSAGLAPAEHRSQAVVLRRPAGWRRPQESSRREGRGPRLVLYEASAVDIGGASRGPAGGGVMWSRSAPSALDA